MSDSDINLDLLSEEDMNAWFAALEAGTHAAAYEARLWRQARWLARYGDSVPLALDSSEE